MDNFINSWALFFALLNPFLMSIYLIDMIRDLDSATFFLVLARGSTIAGVMFVLLAWGGEAIFTDILQVHFASFQVFGGFVFVVIGMRFVFSGADAVRSIRGGSAKHLAGSIAMPFMIGPGTVSAAVIIGNRLSWFGAFAAIALTLIATVATVMLLKFAHDYCRERNEELIERYIDVVGRLSALLIGTIAVEMIFQGVGGWLELPFALHP